MLSDEQKEKLYQAIDAARGPGACDYVEGGKPCCVIAQLAHLEGVSIEDMASTWGVSQVQHISERPYVRGVEFIIKYPVKLLTELQTIWDTCKQVTSEDDAREGMKEKVKNFSDEV